MLQLIYASTATSPLNPSSLKALADEARQRNRHLKVTGMLLYRNGSFLQVLEGEPETVRDLYETIEADPRHEWVTLLKETSVDERDFPGQPLVFQDRSVTRSQKQLLPSAGEEKEASPALFDRSAPADQTLLQFRKAGARKTETHQAAPRQTEAHSSHPATE